jgi:hypothetical protein
LKRRDLGFYRCCRIPQRRCSFPQRSEEKVPHAFFRFWLLCGNEVIADNLS